MPLVDPEKRRAYSHERTKRATAWYKRGWTDRNNGAPKHNHAKGENCPIENCRGHRLSDHDHRAGLTCPVPHPSRAKPKWQRAKFPITDAKGRTILYPPGTRFSAAELIDYDLWQRERFGLTMNFGKGTDMHGDTNVPSDIRAMPPGATIGYARADRLAVKVFHVHPSAIWPSWFDWKPPKNETA